MSRPAHHHRHTKRLFVHETLVEPAMFAQVEPLVGGIDHNRILVQSRAFEIVQYLAHTLVHTCYTSHVVLQVTLVFPFSHFLERTWSGVKLIIAITVSIKKTAAFFRRHCPHESMWPGVKEQAVAVDARNHLQVVTFIHVTIYIHLLHLCCVTSLISIVIIVGKRELGVFIQTIMPFGRHPIAVNGFVVHHQEERLVLVTTVIHPFLTILSDEVSHISFMNSSVPLGNKLWVTVFALVIENHPMVKSRRLGNKMPFTDDGSLITVLLQQFGQRLLRTVKT